ncbi:MAG TPA: imidazole glycerol phosphate synthase subunit HisH [Candidatus Eisenbacteria bacterium]|nr:imidazole glycerol phosphate synthase subunit HisH [Candidatus Eisenbacteria bacterium]
MIVIVDYGAGNLASVVKALKHLGQECGISRDPDIVGQAEKWIIPGVGNFKATAPLANGKLGALLREGAQAGTRPLLGICLGLQWMFEGSSEAPGLRGIGVFAGECARFSGQVKSPHVGWDSILISGQSRLLAGVPWGAYMYFTHSYRAPVCGDTVATCTYEEPFTAVAERGNLFAVQFHPEKSGDAGMQILENFCAL